MLLIPWSDNNSNLRTPMKETVQLGHNSVGCAFGRSYIREEARRSILVSLFPPRVEHDSSSKKKKFTALSRNFLVMIPQRQTCHFLQWMSSVAKSKELLYVLSHVVSIGHCQSHVVVPMCDATRYRKYFAPSSVEVPFRRGRRGWITPLVGCILVLSLWLFPDVCKAAPIVEKYTPTSSKYFVIEIELLTLDQACSWPNAVTNYQELIYRPLLTKKPIK